LGTNSGQENPIQAIKDIRAGEIEKSIKGRPTIPTTVVLLKRPRNFAPKP
jgi:hypothetical protein